MFSCVPRGVFSREYDTIFIAVMEKHQIIALYAKFVRENKTHMNHWQEKIRREQQLKEDALERAARAEGRLLALKLERKIPSEEEMKMRAALEKTEKEELMRFELEEVRISYIY